MSITEFLARALPQHEQGDLPYDLEHKWTIKSHLIELTKVSYRYKAPPPPTRHVHAHVHISTTYLGPFGMHHNVEHCLAIFMQQLLNSSEVRGGHGKRPPRGCAGVPHSQPRSAKLHPRRRQVRTPEARRHHCGSSGEAVMRARMLGAGP